MSIFYLGLGGNSSDKEEMLRRARILVNIYMGQITTASRLYVTAPWGYVDQDEFINQVIAIETNLTPRQLHQALLRVELLLQKKKTSKFGPRNIDIDILLCEERVISEKELEIPHPRMHQRNFVLIPLAEIAPSYIHPVFNKSIAELSSECLDRGSVKPYRSENQ